MTQTIDPTDIRPGDGDADALLDTLDASSGRDLVRLGLAIEQDEVLRSRVGEYVAQLVALADEGPRGSAVQLGALYVLGFLIEDAERIRHSLADSDLDPEDRARLYRRLETLDLNQAELGRCWPSPLVWDVGGERTEDRQIISTLDEDQIRLNWAKDTQCVAAFAGARAHWVATTGRPARVTPPVPVTPPGPPDPAPAVELFFPFADVLRCPVNGGTLALDAISSRAIGPDGSYPIVSGVLDLTPETASSEPSGESLLARLAEMPDLGEYYEQMLRPAFLQIAGGNWSEDLTVEDEQTYLERSLAGVHGRLLDIGCGAGRWTKMIRSAAPEANVLALDMGAPMLAAMRARLPQVPALHASALDIPVADASFDHAVCWNALQAFPDEAKTAISEMGRIVRSGGTLVLLTFLFSDDPVLRYFQRTHYFPSRVEGMLLFEEDELREWLQAAGFEVEDWTTRNSSCLITARRT